MALNNIWVFAQAANGAPTSATLELLTKARSLSSNVTAFMGGDGNSIAAALGEYGATKVYSADHGPHLPGVAIASAMKSVIDGGDKPDLIMFPQNYEGRDTMSRLSVKLNKTVLTNNIDIADSGDGVTTVTPIFGGNTLVSTTFTGEGPFLAAFRRRASLLKPQVVAQRPSLPCRFQTSVPQVARRCWLCMSKRRQVRSSMKPTWWSLVAVASANLTSSPWWKISPRF